MPKYVLTVDSYSETVNRDQVEKGLEEGRVVAPVYRERSKGDVLDVDGAEAERLLAAGAVEEPGESQKRQQEALKAEQAGLQAQIDALEAQADTSGGYADQSKDDLQAEADRRELSVTGSGSGGNVTKGDLVAALEASDAANPPT